MAKYFSAPCAARVLLTLCLSSAWAFGQSGAANAARAAAPVSIEFDAKAADKTIPADFMGLSFEVSLLLPGPNGKHYFRADNEPLVNLFKTLGIKNLRIGGNTSDRNVRRLPEEEDLDSLFAFAKAAGVKVIYCLQLHNGDPLAAARVVKYVMNHYAPSVECFSIGQEPSAYPQIAVTNAAQGMGVEFEKYPYSMYAEEWKRFEEAITAAVPKAQFCGPSVHNNGDWARRFMADFGQSNHVTLITEHLYPGGAGGKIPTPEIGRDRMLGEDFVKADLKLYNSFAPLAASNGLPYRLEEVNNYFNGGASQVSDTYASALWGLDFAHWWAAHGAGGVNFHTGDRVAAGANLQPSRYTAFFSTTNGFLVRPLGYGLKAFEAGAHGTNVPIRISNPENLNISAYAALGGGRDVHFTIINKEHGTNARDANITIHLNQTDLKYAETLALSAPGNDLAAASGITLGGETIQWNGEWKGKGTPLEKAGFAELRKGTVNITVPASAAVVLTCTHANYAESEVGTYRLPDPLVMENGKPVRTARAWVKERRPQILKLYQDTIYGHSPAPPKDLTSDVWEVDRRALGGKAARKQIDLRFAGHANSPVIHVLLYTPADAKGPVPVFLCLQFSGNYAIAKDPGVALTPIWDRRWDTNGIAELPERGTSHSWNISETLARGYGVASVYYSDIEPDLDDGSGARHGVRSLYFSKPGQTNTLAADEWGAIGAWAWGASRVMDYLLRDGDVDGKRIIMTGQSRLGKTALWAGAQDERFAMVVASCSGEMGASLSRRDYGETVNSMSKSYKYQFCRNFLDWSNRIDQMPVDSHMLVSLIAPRPLYLSTGSEDRWSDPHGEFEAAIAAAPVYRLFGKQSVVDNLPPPPPGGGSGSLLDSAVLDTFQMPPLDVPVMRDIGFQTHTGKHDILKEDWDRFLDFADLHFKGKTPAPYPRKRTLAKAVD